MEKIELELDRELASAWKKAEQSGQTEKYDSKRDGIEGRYDEKRQKAKANHDQKIKKIQERG
ncbi:MAG: hypothetical protein O3A50_06705 [Planctomycetota bacterium]|nr:hypothetical protein [Planctomycetota bacterium]